MTDDHRNRREDVIGRPLDPMSLCGSWFHVLEDFEITRQGVVLAEPQPGIYLVEFQSWIDGASIHQRLVTVDQMSMVDEEEWRFYDSDEWMRRAYAERPGAETLDQEQEG